MPVHRSFSSVRFVPERAELPVQFVRAPLKRVGRQVLRKGYPAAYPDIAALPAEGLSLSREIDRYDVDPAGRRREDRADAGGGLVRALTDAMNAASEAEQYERAAAYRDCIRAVRKIGDRQ